MSKFKCKPEEARKLWVEALRSGKFAQAKECLRDKHGYCCLGVACELFRVHEGYGEWDGEAFLENTGDMPEDVRVWLGLRSTNGAMGERAETLASRNDSGMPFAVIADIIESAPPLLFVEATP